MTHEEQERGRKNTVLFSCGIVKQSLAIVEVLTSGRMYGIINYDSKITADHAH